MEQKDKTQNQGNASETADFGTENKKNSQTSSGEQNFGNQQTGSAAAAKKYDTQASGKTETSSKPADSPSSSTGSIQEFYDKAKQSAGQVTEKVTEKAADKLDEKKSVVTQGLADVADGIRQIGGNLRGAVGDEENPVGQFTAKYSDALAGQVEQVSKYFERKDIREIVRDVEGFARRNPAIFIGGAFALGIVAARFLKSSSPKHLTKGKGRSFNSGYSPGEGSRRDFADNDKAKAVNSGSSDSSKTSSSSGLTSTNPS